MEGKLFKESDSWGELSSNELSFSLKKKPKTSKNKSRKRKHEKISEDDFEETGKYVRAPKFYGLEESDEEKSLTNSQKRKERKRKRNDPKDEEKSPIPEKKVKKEHIVNCGQQKEIKSLSYEEQLRESLKGSRFRFLNEQLYSNSSTEAMKIFEEDKSAFTAYHEGYRHQVSQWPMNPLDRIIKQINKMPKNYVIADMGCGDAKLSKSVLQKVYSFDLVAGVEGVIEADMSKVPLDSNSVNVVVYCLSLMGTNLKDFFLEANRILKLNGLLKIAEVQSRFEKLSKFVDFVQKCGFDVVNKDLNENLFYFLTFKKSQDVNSLNKKVPDFSLKPCLYKKR